MSTQQHHDIIFLFLNMFQVSGQVWPSGEDKSQSTKSLVILNIYKKSVTKFSKVQIA